MPSGKNFLDKLIQLSKLRNKSWERLRRPSRAVIESPTWMKTIEKRAYDIQDAVEDQFPKKYGRGLLEYQNAHKKFMDSCLDDRYYALGSHNDCQRRWNNEWYNHIPELPSVEDVDLDPQLYTEHFNPYVREYAIKKINGEID